MAPPSRSNHLLAKLSAADLALLTPHLEPVALTMRKRLEEPNTAIKDVIFPESGIVSVVAIDSRRQEIEAGIIGREGMTGLAIIMGDDRTPNAAFVQVPGSGQRIKANGLREAMEHSESLRLAFLHFAQAFMTQTALTLLANGRATIDQRLARWLLMAQDRLDTSEIPLTHEFMALMLGVTRPGLTVVLSQLRKRKLIGASRGKILLIDRKGLETLAEGIYGVSEDEYRRLTGWSPNYKS